MQSPVLKENYYLYLERQLNVINLCLNILEDKNRTEKDKNKAKKELESFFWWPSLSTPRLFFWSAMKHWWNYIKGEIFDIINLPPEEYDNRYFLKNKIALDEYPKNKEIFEERDKIILKKLKDIKSKYYKELEEIRQNPNYFENFFKNNKLPKKSL